MEPKQILKVKEKQLCNRTIREVLVQWKGYPIKDASWEDWSHLLSQFPYLPKLNTFDDIAKYLIFL